MIHVSLKNKSNTLQDVPGAEESLVGNEKFPVNFMLKLLTKIESAKTDNLGD